jgi:hypothetical protein
MQLQWLVFWRTTMGKAKELSHEEEQIMCWRSDGLKTKQNPARVVHSERAIHMHLGFMKSLPLNGMPLLLKARLGHPTKSTKTQLLRLTSSVNKTKKTIQNSLTAQKRGPRLWWRFCQTIQERGPALFRGLPWNYVDWAMTWKCLTFARSFQSWDAMAWRNVRYRKESIFSLFNSKPVRLVKRGKMMNSTAFSQWCGSAAVARGGGETGRPVQYFLSKNFFMNGERYKQVLVDLLLLLLIRNDLLPQDSAPWHKSNLWCPSSSRPRASSPSSTGLGSHLTPTKACWSYMKRKLKRSSNITSFFFDFLVKAIKMMWDQDMGQDLLQISANSRVLKKLQMVTNRREKWRSIS